MEIEPAPLILPKSRAAQPLPIPSFRRVVSFVGREEGFELFDPTNDLELPSPKIMENIKYFFDAPHEEEHNHGALNFDCADVNNSVILGAIPQVEHPDFPIPAPKPTMKTTVLKPTSQEAKEMDNVISIGTYTRAQRKKKLARYRKKRHDRLFGPKVACKYKCRQRFAKNRPRVHGRFVKLS